MHLNFEQLCQPSPPRHPHTPSTVTVERSSSQAGTYHRRPVAHSGVTERRAADNDTIAFALSLAINNNGHINLFVCRLFTFHHLLRITVQFAVYFIISNICCLLQRYKYYIPAHVTHYSNFTYLQIIMDQSKLTPNSHDSSIVVKA